MTRQFATMANMYQDLIPEKYDVLSILELAAFILDLKVEEFQEIANFSALGYVPAHVGLPSDSVGVSASFP